jgi:serine O-acetyltransferase
MLEDLRSAWQRDPALYGVRLLELLLYQGLWALWGYRLAHRLYRWRVPFLPRALSQYVRALTGIEIHPGATIGRRLFIDHGAGVVIGETSVIGDDVTMYHHVTLGGRGWWRDPKGSRRHPSVGDRVVLGVGATVLGPVHIGDDARIGAHALVLEDVPAGARVDAPASAIIPAPTYHEEVIPCPRTRVSLR